MNEQLYDITCTTNKYKVPLNITLIVGDTTIGSY